MTSSWWVGEYGTGGSSDLINVSIALPAAPALSRSLVLQFCICLPQPHLVPRRSFVLVLPALKVCRHSICRNPFDPLAETMPDRNDAWELLCEYTKGESLRKHAVAVEAAMRACVKRYGSAEDDEDEWGLVGLLHDFDYEMFPTADQHPFTGANILCGRGYSERFIRAIMGHATYTGVPRDTAMARALFATDELCGFLVACALVRPNKSLDDLEVSSVKKKLKDKAFARSVNRDDIRQGIEELGVDLDEHIRFVIDALRPLQNQIGLNALASDSE